MNYTRSQSSVLPNPDTGHWFLSLILTSWYSSTHAFLLSSFYSLMPTFSFLPLWPYFSWNLVFFHSPNLFFPLVSLLLSQLLPSIGSYFVLAISSSIDSFFLYHLTHPYFSYSPTLPFLSACPTVQIAFRSPTANMQPPLTAIIPMQTGTAFFPPIFYAKWSSYL